MSTKSSLNLSVFHYQLFNFFFFRTHGEFFRFFLRFKKKLRVLKNERNFVKFG